MMGLHCSAHQVERAEVSACSRALNGGSNLDVSDDEAERDREREGGKEGEAPRRRPATWTTNPREPNSGVDLIARLARQQ